MGVPLYTDEDHNHFVDLYFVLLYKFQRKAFLDEVSITELIVVNICKVESNLLLFVKSEPQCLFCWILFIVGFIALPLNIFERATVFWQLDTGGVAV